MVAISLILYAWRWLHNGTLGEANWRAERGSLSSGSHRQMVDG
jgi:hypothetical protein